MTVITEGANMPSTSAAIELMHEKKIEFGPAKAANAGACKTFILSPRRDLSFICLRCCTCPCDDGKLTT